MAAINTYTERVAPQGSVGGQADGVAFGANVGASLQNVGASMLDVAETMRKQEVQADLTRVYSDMANARTEFTAGLRDRTANAAPGDQTFAAGVRQSVDESLAKLADRYTTPEAKREFQRLSADLSSQFTIKAIEIQGHLAAQGAIENDAQRSRSLGSVVFQDPTQLDAAIQQRDSEIDNPDGLYKSLPQSERDKVKRLARTDLIKSAMMGRVQQDPESFLERVSPDKLSKFRQTDTAVTKFTSTAPQTNAKVQSLAPVIQENADKYGVDANILTAQLMEESRGQTNATSPKGARGVSQFMPGTAARYGVDVTNDNSSVRGQANYMSDLLKMFNGDYAKALAGYNWGEGNVQKAVNKYGSNWLESAPAETKKYVAKVMDNAGVMSVTGQPPVVTDRAPVSIGDKQFDSLPWHDQYTIIQTAQQQVRANQAQSAHAIAEAERKRKEAQDKSMQTLLDKLEFGNLSPQDVRNAPDLDFQHREHMYNAIRIRAGRMDNTDAGVFNDVAQQVVSGKVTDPEELYKYIGHGLSMSNIQQLQEIVRGKGTPVAEQRKEFINMAKRQISGTNDLMGIADPEGDAQFYKFFSEFTQVLKDKQKAGVPLADMLTPGANNREYIGWLVDKYKRTPQQRMQAAANVVRGAANNVTPGAEPRKQGETVDQYLKRTGGE